MEPNNNENKCSHEDEQVKFHQKLLQAQKRNTNEILKTNVPGLLSPKLFSAEQVEAMQLLQAHQVQAQMQQVYQQVHQKVYIVKENLAYFSSSFNKNYY